MLRRYAIAEAVYSKRLCDATYAGNAPFHITEGNGLAQLRNFHDLMDSIIKTPEQKAAESAAEDQRTFDAIAARAAAQAAALNTDH